MTTTLQIPLTAETVSTHTLTWSVTDSFEFEEINGEVSTHTLTWSVTAAVTMGTATIAGFNSHAHVERDISVVGQVYAEIGFNSHAHVERDAVKIL